MLHDAQAVVVRWRGGRAGPDARPVSAASISAVERRRSHATAPRSPCAAAGRQRDGERSRPRRPGGTTTAGAERTIWRSSSQKASVPREPRGDEQGRGNLVALEHRERRLQVVEVAVVEGDDDPSGRTSPRADLPAAAERESGRSPAITSTCSRKRSGCTAMRTGRRRRRRRGGRQAEGGSGGCRGHRRLLPRAAAALVDGADAGGHRTGRKRSITRDARPGPVVGRRRRVASSVAIASARRRAPGGANRPVSPSARSRPYPGRGRRRAPSGHRLEDGDGQTS